MKTKDSNEMVSGWKLGSKEGVWPIWR